MVDVVSRAWLCCKALDHLQTILDHENGLDIAVLRAQKAKRLGSDHYPHLPLSSLRLWNIIDADGHFNDHQAQLANILIEKNHSQLHLVVSPEESITLSELDKLVLDAITLYISEELQAAADRLIDQDAVITHSFHGIPLLNILHRPDDYRQILDHRRRELEQEVEHSETTWSMKETKSSLEKYEQLIQSINHQEQERKEFIEQSRAPYVHHFNNLITELEKLCPTELQQAATTQLMKELDKINRLLWRQQNNEFLSPEAARAQLNPYQAEVQILKTWYHRILIELLYRSAKDQRVSTEIMNNKSLADFDEPSLAHQTLHQLFKHFTALCDSQFTFGLGIKQSNNPKASLAHSYQLAILLSDRMKHDEHLQKNFNKAKDELFITQVFQQILLTSLSKQGWGTVSEPSFIVINEQRYSVPKSVAKQYQAILLYLEHQQTAKETVELLRKQAKKLATTCSRKNSPYFSLFKNQMTTREQKLRPSPKA